MRQYISPMTASDICAPQGLLMTSSSDPAAATYSVNGGENNHLQGGNTGGLISGAL